MRHLRNEKPREERERKKASYCFQKKLLFSFKKQTWSLEKLSKAAALKKKKMKIALSPTMQRSLLGIYL